MALMRRKNGDYKRNEEYRELPNEIARKIGDLLPLTKQEKIIKQNKSKLKVFSINYNILKIMSGMDNLTYSN